MEHEDNGSINFMSVVNVPESRMNMVDSPSYACPAVMDDTSAPSTEDGASGIGSSSATRWGGINYGYSLLLGFCVELIVYINLMD